MNPKQLTNSRNCSRHSYSNGVLFLRLFLNIIMSIRVNSVSTQHQNTSSPIPTSTVCVSNQHIVFKLRFVIMRVASNGALLHSRDKRFVLDFCLCACFFLHFTMLIFQRKDSEYFHFTKWICTVPFYGMKLLKHNEYMKLQGIRW